MFGNLRPDQVEGAVEAMLFVTDRPVSTLTMADMLECEPATVEAACVDLRARLSEDRSGIQLAEVAGGWQLRTHPAYHELLENYVLSWDTTKLSQAALEVLAIVAYTQPVTRNAVSNVRGVNSESSISSLIEKDLVREVGVDEDAPGRPALLGTTRRFLSKFGLRSLSDLPDLDDYAPDDETRRFIRRRLSIAKGAVPETAGGEAQGEPAGGEGGEAAEAAREDGQESLDDLMRNAMGDALAQAAGAVEKIDFDDLEFEE